MSLFSGTFFAFMAVLTALYFLLPKKCQWAILLAASVVFYLAGGWQTCFYILVTIVTQYLLARILEKQNRQMAAEMEGKKLSGAEKKVIRIKYAAVKKRYLILSLVINLGILIFLKIADVTICEINGVFGTEIRELNLLLPIGLSYYTFKAVGYVIDVYRGRIHAEQNIFKLALYVGYFPALVQGPIDRYENLAHQLYAEHTFSYRRLCFGAQRMLWGYIKKLVIADRAAVIIDTVISNYTERNYGGFIVFFAVALNAFRVYSDFAGGMDIVIGLSEIFGITLTENFERPFFATSIAEYWQRWHITLGAWMRTYVFYPLSLSPTFNKLGKKCRKVFGDRNGKLIAPSLASFITFFLIGMWHGTGWKYVVYGIYQASFVAAGTLLQDFYTKARQSFKIREDSHSWHLFQIIRTFFMVVFARYFTIAKDMPDVLGLLKATVSQFNPWVFFDGTFYNLGLTRPDFWVLMVSLAVLMVVDFAQEKGVNIRERIERQSTVVRWAIYYAAFFVLAIFGIYGPGYDAANFIYQRF